MYDELRKRMESGKPHKESEMHNLFFPMIKTDREVDYDTNNWYYLGTFNNTAIWTLLCREDDPELEEKQSLMEIGGIWFILED